MTAVAVLRELWNRRLLVAVGFALALMLGMLMVFNVSLGLPPQFESRQYEVGVASAGVLVDSPSSQAVDLGTAENKADLTSLSTRARLLANLMATSPLKDRIAKTAGVDPEVLIARAPTIGPGSTPSAVEAGSNARASDPGATVLSVYVNEVLPIITADAQGPTPAVAARISSAAVTELQAFLKSVAATDAVPNARQLVVEPLGPARAAADLRGPRRLFAVAGFLFAFALWCTGIVVSSRLVRAWRAAEAAEPPAAGSPPADPGLSIRSAAPPAAARTPASGPAAVPERPERPDRARVA